MKIKISTVQPRAASLSRGPLKFVEAQKGDPEALKGIHAAMRGVIKNLSNDLQESEKALKAKDIRGAFEHVVTYEEILENW